MAESPPRITTSPFPNIIPGGIRKKIEVPRFALPSVGPPVFQHFFSFATTFKHEKQDVTMRMDEWCCIDFATVASEVGRGLQSILAYSSVTVSIPSVYFF